MSLFHPKILPTYLIPCRCRSPSFLLFLFSGRLHAVSSGQSLAVCRASTGCTALQIRYIGSPPRSEIRTCWGHMTGQSPCLPTPRQNVRGARWTWSPFRDSSPARVRACSCVCAGVLAPSELVADCSPGWILLSFLSPIGALASIPSHPGCLSGSGSLCPPTHTLPPFKTACCLASFLFTE